MMSSLQNVSDRDRSMSADRLREGHPGALNLIRSGLAAKLRRRLDDLIRAARSHRVSPGFQTPERRDRDAPPRRVAAVGRPLQGLAARGESTRFERQSGNDGERVVRLEKIDVLGLEAARQQSEGWPRRASSSAIARPIPDVAPAITTTRPFTE